ncbi:hypothetical protein [Rubrivirga sp.]|uniref:hypothetical protein n=1 Tax=Rubrivirga sp. TaxID=1885344 RepID=UPI003B529ECD
MTRPALLGLLALAACQAPLDPIEPSDLVFSLSGHLDASADTQWVRVEAFGRTVNPHERPLAAEVELVAADGRRERLTQAVRALATGPAHLFWTTMPVEPGRTYRLVARAPDGAEARTDVAIPSLDHVTVALLDGFLSCPTVVRVEGAARLVDAWVRYELRGAGRVGERYEFDKRPSLAVRPDGTRDASVYFGDDAARMEIPGLPLAYPVATEIGVAIGTADWPDVAGLDVEEALAEVSLGHVEGGVGFVGGTVTRAFPFVPGFGRIPPFEGSGIEPEPCVSGPRVGAE